MSSTFVVQSFFSSPRGSLIADAPIPAQDTHHARRMAERLAESKTFVVALVRCGESPASECGEARLIAAFGAVPDEVLEMPRA